MTGNFHKDLALLIGFVVVYIMLALLLTGCARKPGQPFPYTTSSYAEDDVVYNGVGITF